MNIFLALKILRLNESEVQIMLFDRHADGPYKSFLQRVFSPNHEVIRASHYQGRKVMFRTLVFHLESPAALIFPKVHRPVLLHFSAAF